MESRNNPKNKKRNVGETIVRGSLFVPPWLALIGLLYVNDQWNHAAKETRTLLTKIAEASNGNLAESELILNNLKRVDEEIRGAQIQNLFSEIFRKLDAREVETTKELNRGQLPKSTQKP